MKAATRKLCAVGQHKLGKGGELALLPPFHPPKPWRRREASSLGCAIEPCRRFSTRRAWRAWLLHLHRAKHDRPAGRSPLGAPPSSPRPHGSTREPGIDRIAQPRAGWSRRCCSWSPQLRDATSIELCKFDEMDASCWQPTDLAVRMKRGASGGRLGEWACC